MDTDTEVSFTVERLTHSRSESSTHDVIMHDCNRHRENGYKDKTWEHRISKEQLDNFKNKRDNDRNRKQNLVNNIFPQLADARDTYIKQEQDETRRQLQDMLNSNNFKDVGVNSEDSMDEEVDNQYQEIIKEQVDEGDTTLLTRD